MLVKLLFAILNGIITWVVFTLLVVLLGMVGFGQLAVFAPFIMLIAVIVAVLTFLGAIAPMWSNLIK